MRRRTTVLTLALGLLLGTLAPGALAQPPEGRGHSGPLVGEQIDILAIHAAGGWAEFPADTPFHVRHGWLWERGGDYALREFGELFDFRLEIAGVDQGDGLLRLEPSGRGNILHHWVFNFPDGLSEGRYDVVGRWIGPCEAFFECEEGDTWEYNFAIQLFVGMSPWIGERIDIIEIFGAGGWAEFPADTPFHVRHGWLFDPDGDYTLEAFGELFDFRLEIDGVDQGDGLLIIEALGGGFYLHWWVFNFPEGLSEDTYHFEGFWIAPEPETSVSFAVEVAFVAD